LSPEEIKTEHDKTEVSWPTLVELGLIIRFLNLLHRQGWDCWLVIAQAHPLGLLFLHPLGAGFAEDTFERFTGGRDLRDTLPNQLPGNETAKVPGFMEAMSFH
jgi:hypothetical protein